jgi:hypothetical protein
MNTQKHSFDMSRRALWILLALLCSTAAHGQSVPPDIPLATGADACKYALIYTGANLIGSQADTGLRIDLGVCEDWAVKHSNWEAAHNSYVALESLYDLQSAALKGQLYPTDGAPPVCRVFQDYQGASYDAIKAGVVAHLSETEISEKAAQAGQDFLTRLDQNFEESHRAAEDLLACSKWAFSSGRTVIALRVGLLAKDINGDNPGLIPAEIESAVPACKNAESEARAISDFTNHADGDSIMPRDVEPYYERATILTSCSVRLIKTKYRDAYEHLIVAVMGIDNLMVIAEGNSQAKLIHAMPPTQPNRPIVINVQNSYEQTPSPRRCTGTVLNFGSMSDIDWNCR